MPSKTFLNLPEAKKQKIMDAALHEFSVRPVEHAKVSNIIKETGISRGAFYKYFTDITDLYQYFYDSIKLDAHQKLYDALTSTNGDIFAALDYFFEHLLEYFDSTKYKQYFKVMILGMNSFTEEKYMPGFGGGHQVQEHFKRMLNLKTLKIDSDEEFTLFLAFLTDMMHDLLKRHFMEDHTVAETLQAYRMRSHWLQDGVKKRG